MNEGALVAGHHGNPSSLIAHASCRENPTDATGRS